LEGLVSEIGVGPRERGSSVNFDEFDVGGGTGKAIKISVALGCGYLVVWAGLLAALGYTIFHFVSKYW